MAAVTGTVVALGGLGLSAAQAIKANQQMKQASKAASDVQNLMRNIKEADFYGKVQVPTLGFELAQQGQAQATTQAIEASKGAGAEGVIGGVGNIVAATAQADLDRAAKQAEIEAQIELERAAGRQGKAARDAERQFYGLVNEAQSLQQQRTAAQEQMNSAIQGMFSSAGTALTSGAKAVNLYRKKGKGQGNVSGSGINWNTMSNNQLPAGVTGPNQPFSYNTGSTISNATANDLTGNIPGQVIFQ